MTINDDGKLRPDTVEDWQTTVRHCYTAAHLLRQFDLKWMLEQYQPDAVAVIAPSLWIEKQDHEVLKAAYALVRAIELVGTSISTSAP